MSCWACGRGHEHPWWCREAQQREEARLREIAKLERAQKADMNRRHRVETQRLGPSLLRTFSLTEWDLNREDRSQPWTS
jgi:hypothetical protein